MTGGYAIQESLASTPVSRTWRVLAAGQPAVWRVDEPGAARLGLDRRAEPAVLRAVSAAGLGPACLGADPDRGWLLTEWVPGRAWQARDLQDADNLRRAAGLLRQVHALPPVGPRVDLAAAIDRYTALGGPGAAEAGRAARAQLARCLAADEGAGGATAGVTAGAVNAALCLCHNDPTPGNFIAAPDGGLRLIDWEYAGLGHPAFDLAGLAVGAALDPAGDDLLLGAYLGRPPGPADRARHDAWKAFCRALGGLWAGALI